MVSIIKFVFSVNSWSGKAVCEFPGEPDEGYIVPTKFHYFVGEGISVVCKGNHQPLGPAFIYCTTEGKWSAPLPSCAITSQTREDVREDIHEEEANGDQEEKSQGKQPHYHGSMASGEKRRKHERLQRETEITFETQWTSSTNNVLEKNGLAAPDTDTHKRYWMMMGWRLISIPFLGYKSDT